MSVDRTSSHFADDLDDLLSCYIKVNAGDVQWGAIECGFGLQYVGAPVRSTDGYCTSLLSNRQNPGQIPVYLSVSV